MTRNEFHRLYDDPHNIFVGDLACSIRKAAIFSLYAILKCKIANPKGIKSCLSRIGNTVSCSEEEILKHFEEYCSNG